MAANPNNPPVLVERTEIHKSCKSLETLLNVFNDYCEAAGAVVVLQKKLAKALRETAGLKITGEIAANVLNASANIYEALVEIDSKFSKIADKEYDSVSGEVKKWFKKLAKEEKIHDERMANGNAKIKQAGQAYEKKSKKKGVDVTDEHARYINLINSLGPEMSQDKYNHTLFVTQRHTATSYSVAAALARIADAEWLRSCESVRRFSPTVGILGEWRALCEGGWIGPVPRGLPNIDVPQQEVKESEQTQATHEDSQNLLNPRPLSAEPESQGPAELNRTDNRPPLYSSTERLVEPITPVREHPSWQQQNASMSSGGSNALSPPSSYDPSKPWVDPNTGSVRSLSAFPYPPTHFPIPPPREPSAPSSLAAQVEFPVMPRVAESPLPEDDGSELSYAVQEMVDGRSLALQANPSSERFAPSPGSVQSSPRQEDKPSAIEIGNTSMSITSENETTSRPPPARSHPEAYTPRRDDLTRSQRADSPFISRSPKGDYFESGRDSGPAHNSGQIPESRAIDTPKRSAFERTDTESSGSIIAAMKSRYTNNPSSTSPPPKDIPKLPLSVTDLATRYQPTDAPSSPPRPGAKSPPIARHFSHPPLDSSSPPRQYPETFYREQDRAPSSPGTGVSMQRPPPLSSSPSYSTIPENEPSSYPRLQRLNEVGILEQREKELRDREREIEAKSRELERDRLRLQGIRDVEGSSNQGQMQVNPRERRSSLLRKMQQKTSQSDIHEQANANGPSRPRHSYSANQLVTPSPTSPRNEQNSQPPSPSHYQQQREHERRNERRYPDKPEDLSAHAPYCGCETCSVAKYKANPPQRPKEGPTLTGNALRPSLAATPGKQKGSWIRRLSMPGVMGNAFNLDSKRNSGSSMGIGSGIEGGKGISSLDAKKNVSTTNLRPGGRDNIQEDGRMGAGRRSYDASAVSNRSMTNLGITSRR